MLQLVYVMLNQSFIYLVPHERNLKSFIVFPTFLGPPTALLAQPRLNRKQEAMNSYAIFHWKQEMAQKSFQCVTEHCNRRDFKF